MSLGVLARVVVGLVLLVAGALKTRQREWPETAAAFGLPRSVAPVLPWVELVLGALLIVQMGGRWTALAAAGLLGAFTAAVGVRVARHEEVPCACFGASSSKPVSGRTIVRNVVLLGVALAGVLL